MPSIYFGCHCISRHAITEAEIQYLPYESHSADLTIKGHNTQLSNQHNPCTIVSSEEKKEKNRVEYSIFLTLLQDRIFE